VVVYMVYLLSPAGVERVEGRAIHIHG
jgi:hypothetical protein